MKYMGSKNRISKYILPIILKNRAEEQYYVEPFVGGCNSIDDVSGNRIGADINPYLIGMWKGLQEGLAKPTTITRDLYSTYRDKYNKDKNGSTYPSEEQFLIGWVGFMASYNGRFYDGGYSGKSAGRDYVSEQIRNTLKQLEKVKTIEFYHSSYDGLKIPSNSIIYCDIPYKNTKNYAYSTNFNHAEFFQWCRKMKEIGHVVFISEYNAPQDFKCVWQIGVTNSMHPTKTTKSIEKLYTL